MTMSKISIVYFQKSLQQRRQGGESKLEGTIIIITVTREQVYSLAKSQTDRHYILQRTMNKVCIFKALVFKSKVFRNLCIYGLIKRDEKKDTTLKTVQ